MVSDFVRLHVRFLPRSSRDGPEPRDEAPAIDLAHLVQTPLDQIRFDPEIERNRPVGAPTSHALEDVDAVRLHRLFPEQLSEHLELPAGVDGVALRP